MPKTMCSEFPQTLPSNPSDIWYKLNNTATNFEVKNEFINCKSQM